jgi:hypothetical protein
MHLRKRAILLTVLGTLLSILVGCETPQTMPGTKPEDRLNPAFSATQKAKIIKRKQEMGDLPTR